MSSVRLLVTLPVQRVPQHLSPVEMGRVTVAASKVVVRVVPLSCVGAQAIGVPIAAVWYQIGR